MPERNEAQNRAVANLSSGGVEQTMSSREIADLVEKRHDNVKRTIEMLMERGVITSPQIEEKPTAGRPSMEYIFSGEQGKRDSIVVVAQLSPEFTARLVDRWQELEAAAVKPLVPQSLPEALRLAADLAEQVQAEKERAAALEAQTVADAPKVAFAEQVEAAPDALTMGMVAKILGTGRTRLSEKLKQMGWLTRWGEPYQAKIEAGFLAVKITKWEHPTDGLRQRSTPLVTGKGMARLNVVLAEWLAMQNPKKGGA